LQVFQATGYKLVVITNQGVNILDVFFCPHGSKSACSCRKPQPGMLLEARDKFNIDMQNSWVIGDKEADVQAANAVGIDNTILVKSGHVIDETNSNAKFILKSIKDSTQIIT
jgi:D-glycero-D-manno-heptose 1,7-bisphosphate phosphatase